MPDPSPQHSREIPLGNAHALLAPHLHNFEIPLESTIVLPEAFGKIPWSLLSRLQSTMIVRVNLPALYLAKMALPDESRRQTIDDVITLAREMSADLASFGPYFAELNSNTIDRSRKDNDLPIEGDLLIVSPQPSQLQFSYLTAVYRFQKADAQEASPRIARSLESIVQFCVMRGLERCIERICDNAARSGGLYEFQSAAFPLPRNANAAESVDNALPFLIKPSYLSKGGTLGSDRPFIKVEPSVVRVRIPLLTEKAEIWSHYLNENDLARNHGILAHYVELSSTHPQIAPIITELASRLSAGPYDPKSNARRREPGYWMIEAPLDPQNQTEGLKALVQYLATFRTLLRRGELFWEASPQA